MARIHRFRHRRQVRRTYRRKLIFRVGLILCFLVGAEKVIHGRVTWPQDASQWVADRFVSATDWVKNSPAVESADTAAPAPLREAGFSAEAQTRLQSTWARRPATSATPDFEARVSHVFDGDTIEVRRSHGETLRVRLHGIDAPEHGQAYGHAARRTLETLITKEPVAVEVIDVDRFGRSVAVVYQGERNLNLEMVRRGYAWWYRQYAKDDDTLRNAEEEAKEAQLGLWKDDNPRPPWDWRREAP